MKCFALLRRKFTKLQNVCNVFLGWEREEGGKDEGRQGPFRFFKELFRFSDKETRDHKGTLGVMKLCP